MTNLLIIVGAVAVSLAAGYCIMRLCAFVDGRPWTTDPEQADMLEMMRDLWDIYYSAPED